MADERLRHNVDGSVDRRMDDGTYIRLAGPGADALMDVDPNPAPAPAPEPAKPKRNDGGYDYGSRLNPKAGLYMDTTANPSSGAYGAPTPEAAAKAEEAAAKQADFEDVSPGPAARALAAAPTGPQFATVTNTDRRVERNVDSPEIREQFAKMNAAEDAQAELERRRIDRQSEGLAAQADGALKQQQIEEAHLARQQQRETERKTYVDGMRRKREEAEQKFMNSEVDPDKYWTDRGTAGRILGGIGILVSGLGQANQAGGGQTGTTNAALDMIDKAIARDIDAQKANIAKAGDAVGMLDGALANYRDTFGDETLAEQAAYLTSYNIVGRELDRAMAGNKRADLAVARDQVQTMLDAKKAKLAMEMEQGFAGKEAITRQTKQVPITGVATPGSVEARMALPDGGIPGFLVGDRNAFAQVANDEVSYRKLRDAVSANRQMQKASSLMASLVEQYGAEMKGTEARSKYDAAKGQMIGAINLARGAGVLNESEYERLKEEIPGMGWGMADAARLVTAGKWNPRLNQINGIKSLILSNTDAQLEAWGGRLAGGAGGADLPTSEAGEAATASVQEWQ